MANADEAAIASVSVPLCRILLMLPLTAIQVNILTTVPPRTSDQRVRHRVFQPAQTHLPLQLRHLLHSPTRIGSTIRSTPTPNTPPKSAPLSLMVHSFSRRCVTRSSLIHEVRGPYTKVGAVRENILEDSIVQEQNCCPTDLRNCFQQTFPGLYSTRPPEKSLRGSLVLPHMP